MSHWVQDDGGRAAAGFKGDTGDCVTRSIAIATGLPYREVYDALYVGAFELKHTAREKRRPSSPRKGVHKPVYDKFLKGLGWIWTPTRFIGEGCNVHLREDELPDGRIICRCSRHLVAVIDGVIHDTFDPSRGGTRAVYGYYSEPPRAKIEQS